MRLSGALGMPFARPVSHTQHALCLVGSPGALPLSHPVTPTTTKHAGPPGTTACQPVAWLGAMTGYAAQALDVLDARTIPERSKVP